MNKFDIVIVVTALLPAFSFRCYKEISGELIYVYRYLNSHTHRPRLSLPGTTAEKKIGNLLVGLERRAIASTGVAKLRQAGPPYRNRTQNHHRHATTNKSDIILVFTALLLAFSFRNYKENGVFSTLPTHPSTEIVVAGNNETIGNLFVELERRAIASNGMAKLRQAGLPCRNRTL